jgi:hypothetical protein
MGWRRSSSRPPSSASAGRPWSWTTTTCAPFQDTLCADPQVGDLIQGTGGVRKVRLELQGRGKSGGARVVYVDFAVEEQLYLISVFAKNEQDNLTAKQKKEIRDFVKSL